MSARDVGQRVRRVTRRALEPFILTRPEAYAKKLRQQSKTVREIMDAFTSPGAVRKVAQVAASLGDLTRHEMHQITAIRSGLDGGEKEDARRTVLRWLAKGNLQRPSPPASPPDYVPVWIDRVRCVICGREEAALRKILTLRDVPDHGGGFLFGLLPSGSRGRGYCRTCKHYRRFLVVDSRRVRGAIAKSLTSAWARQPSLARSRFLLAWPKRAWHRQGRDAP